MLSGIDDPGESRMGEISTSGSTRERGSTVIGFVPLIPCSPLYSTGENCLPFLNSLCVLCGENLFFALFDKKTRAGDFSFYRNILREGLPV
jgi:hypothetical protein